MKKRRSRGDFISVLSGEISVEAFMKGKLQFSDFTKWATAARAQGLELYGSSNGSVAQDGPRGTCCGFWGYGTKRGWLSNKK